MPRHPGETRNHKGKVSRAGSTYPRARANAACQVCRARRTKCDNARPCSTCRRLGVSCSAEPTLVTDGFDPASLHILAKIEELREDIRALSPHHASSLLSRGSKTDGGFQLTDDHHDQDSSIATPSYASHATDIRHHLQQGNLNQVLAWPVWAPFDPPRALRNLGALDSETLSDPSHTKRPLLAEQLDFDNLADYLEDFLRDVNIKNPILNERDLRHDLHRLLASKNDRSSRTCLLLLTLANGALSSAFPAHSPSPPRADDVHSTRWRDAQALFHAAEDRRPSLASADYLTEAQCHFYRGVFHMALMQPFEAWRQFLQGLASCQPLTSPSATRDGLDISADTSPEAAMTRQAEESTYWSCWKSERELRLELQLPDFQTAGNNLHPAMFPSLPENQSPESLRVWYFYLAEISLWRIETTARQDMAQFARDRPSATLDELAGDIVTGSLKTLKAWENSLPSVIDFGVPDAAPSGGDVLRYILQGRLSYNLEVLTWPFIEVALFSDTVQQNAARMEMIRQGVYCHFQRLEINRPGFYHRHHGTWLMQQSSTRSACVLLAVALGSFAHVLPAGWREMVGSTIEMLHYWGEGSENGMAAFLLRVCSQVDASVEAL